MRSNCTYTHTPCSRAYTPITLYLAWPCLPFNRDSYIRRIFLGTYAYIKVVKRHSATTHHTIIHQQRWMGEEEQERGREREGRCRLMTLDSFVCASCFFFAVTWMCEFEIVVQIRHWYWWLVSSRSWIAFCFPGDAHPGADEVGNAQLCHS